MIYFLQFSMATSSEGFEKTSKIVDFTYWKVGFSNHIENRLTALAHKHANHESYSAFVIEGTMQEEKALHKKFEEYRVLNEYYADVDGLIWDYVYQGLSQVTWYLVENRQFCPVGLEKLDTQFLEVCNG